MEPEQQARQEIDRQLAAAGWLVQDHKAMNLAAGPGIAVREFPLDTGPVDYLLYAGGKVIGVVEAKPEGHPLKGVEIQSRKYTLGVPAHLPAWRRPPPFAYESTGAVTQFTNGLEPDARSREVFTFHKPVELVRLAGLEAQVRGRLRSMPALAPSALWPVQRRTIENLERSRWGTFDWPLVFSSEERAILVLLQNVPERESIYEAYVLLQGLVTLRPERVSALLRACHSIKAKRLFLALSQRLGHAWFKHLDLKKVDLGTGKRSLFPGGRLDAKYQITLPADIDEHAR